MVLHVKLEFNSNRDTLTYFTAKNTSKPFICICGLKNQIEASDLVYTLTCTCICEHLTREVISVSFMVFPRLVRNYLWKCRILTLFALAIKWCINWYHLLSSWDMPYAYPAPYHFTYKCKLDCECFEVLVILDSMKSMCSDTPDDS